MSECITHEVFIQSTALAGARLFSGNRALQAALLRQYSTNPGFAAICASRLAERSDVFGALPAGCDLAAILGRAQRH